MEFELLERKFKLLNQELFSLYKKGNSKTEKWYKINLTLKKDGYQKFNFTVKGKTKTFQFHRVVYYANYPNWNIYDSSKNNCIDHIDRIRTNNHISNLRVVTNQENQFNKNSKGYFLRKRTGKYEAKINLNGKYIYIGSFDTPEEAHQAYLNKKDELHIIQIRTH